MTIKFPNVGEIIWLTRFLAAGDFHLHLFKNDYTPVDGTDLTDLTEADFTDYAAKTLTAGNWPTPTIVSNVASSTYPDEVWTWGSSQTIYGWYLTDDFDTEVICAERLGAIAKTSGQSLILGITLTGATAA